MPGGAESSRDWRLLVRGEPGRAARSGRQLGGGSASDGVGGDNTGVELPVLLGRNAVEVLVREIVQLVVVVSLGVGRRIGHLEDN